MRTNQKLINYNTSGLTMPAIGKVDHGEIVVRWATNQPELLIKIDSGDTETFAVFKDYAAIKNYVDDSITAVTGNISGLEQKVNDLSGATDTFINTTAPDTYLKKTDAATIYQGQSAMTNYYTKTDADDKFLTMESAQTTYATSGDVVTAINAVKSIADGNTSDISTLSGRVQALEGFSAEVATNFATKEYANTQATNAKDSAISSAKTYVDGLLENYATSGDVVNAINVEKVRAEGVENGLRTDVNTLTGQMATITAENGLSATVISDHNVITGITTTYETKTDATAKYNSAVTYVETVSGNIETYIQDTYWTSGETNNKLTAITQNIADISGSVVSTSAAVETLSGDVVSYIDTKLSTVYKYKGSVADYAALTAITEHEVGDVYNVVAAHGNIGDSDYTPAGTNYAWNGSAWDALGGTIDLSTYATVDYVTGITSGLTSRVAALESNDQTLEGYIGSVSGQLETLSDKVVSDYYTKNDADGKFLTQTGAEATYLTKTDAETTYQTITGAQATYLTISSATSRATEVDTNISTLSGSTVAIETKANNSISAVTTGAVSTPSNTTNDEYASGVKIKNDNTNRGVTFDFSELIIDCGSF